MSKGSQALAATVHFVITMGNTVVKVE